MARTHVLSSKLVPIWIQTKLARVLRKVSKVVILRRNKLNQTSKEDWPSSVPVIGSSRNSGENCECGMCFIIKASGGKREEKLWLTLGNVSWSSTLLISRLVYVSPIHYLNLPSPEAWQALLMPSRKICVWLALAKLGNIFSVRPPPRRVGSA